MPFDVVSQQVLALSQDSTALDKSDGRPNIQMREKMVAPAVAASPQL